MRAAGDKDGATEFGRKSRHKRMARKVWRGRKSEHAVLFWPRDTVQNITATYLPPPRA